MNVFIANDAVGAVTEFAQAAANLLDAWWSGDEDVENALTATYPSGISISFDELVAELNAWAGALQEKLREPNPTG